MRGSKFKAVRMAWRVLEIWLTVVKEPSALLIPGKAKAPPTQSLGKPLAGQRKEDLSCF